MKEDEKEFQELQELLKKKIERHTRSRFFYIDVSVDNKVSALDFKLYNKIKARFKKYLLKKQVLKYKPFAVNKNIFHKITNT